jgi:hypothetical protein
MSDEGVTKGRTTFARATREIRVRNHGTPSPGDCASFIVTDARDGDAPAKSSPRSPPCWPAPCAVAGDSGAQVREFLAENAKRLQRKIMQAVDDPDTKRFRESWFNGDDVAGRA